MIVGRCADYALADFPNVVNVYLYADLQSRIARIARRHDVTDAKAKDLIQKTDKGRASYYNYYTNKKVGRGDRLRSLPEHSQPGHRRLHPHDSGVRGLQGAGA